MNVYNLSPAEWAVINALTLQLGWFKEQALDHGAVFILPASTMPDATRIYGIPVIHADAPEPMVAFPVKVKDAL